MTSRLIAQAVIGTPFVAGYLYKKNMQTVSEPECVDVTRKAICVLDPQPNQTASGVVHFEQAHFYSKTKISGTFKGLAEGNHGFHIHQFGNLTQGCTTAGPHYNPFAKTHGGPDKEVRHVGDLGNVVADQN